MVVAWIRLVSAREGLCSRRRLYRGLDGVGRWEDESPADSWLVVHGGGDIFRETLEREQACQEGRVSTRYMLNLRCLLGSMYVFKV